MDIYTAGGFAATLVYLVVRLIKPYVNKRYLPLISLALTPTVCGVIAWLLGDINVTGAIKMGMVAGTGAISIHETIGHTIKGKS